MKKIGLFYFSGTGNTEYVTRQFEKYFLEKETEVSIFAVDNIQKNNINIDFNRYDIIGIGFPVYAWREPLNVLDFVKEILVLKGKKAFIYLVPGSNWGLAAADLRVKRILKGKGMDVFYQRTIVMPSNFVEKYDDNLSKELCNTACKKAEISVNEILQEKRRERKYDPGEAFLSGVGLCEEFGVWIHSRFFYAKKNCIKCGLCIKNCPRNNITMKNDKIKFGSSCLLCMRCFYICPKDSISTGIFDFIKLKDGYNLKNILENKNLTGNYTLSHPKSYLKKYIENDNE